MDNYTHVFIVGIKGVGMANIAILLKQMGSNVSGSDVGDEFDTDKTLTENQIRVISSFDKKYVPHDCDALVYSASNGGTTNPQVIEAKERGVPVFSQAEFINTISRGFRQVLAVCGTHGKTTTASLLVYLLNKLQASPSYVVGTSIFNDVAGGGFHGTNYFVFEADEYAVDAPRDRTPKLEYYSPDYAICTSIDFDHPDVYLSIDDTKKTFEEFFKKIAAKTGKVILCLDDNNLRDVSKRIFKGAIVSYGQTEEADYQIKNLSTQHQMSVFEMWFNGNLLGTFQTRLFGSKIVGNVCGAIVLLHQLGLHIDEVKKYLPDFIGAKRRFEYVGSTGGIDLYDDYAHHPSEITATLEAAREKFGNRRLLVIFQPHTYSRTEKLQNEFVEALSQFDQAYIAPVFASAREERSNFTITSKKLEQLAQKKNFTTITSYESIDELKAKLRQVVKMGDVVFTMGAGDIYKLKFDILSMLKST